MGWDDRDQFLEPCVNIMAPRIYPWHDQIAVRAIVNIQENIGKTVGNRVGMCNPLDAPGGGGKANRRNWRDAFKNPFVPKGVYRFKTHEEADDWLMKMLTRTRRD